MPRCAQSSRTFFDKDSKARKKLFRRLEVLLPVLASPFGKQTSAVHVRYIQPAQALQYQVRSISRWHQKSVGEACSDVSFCDRQPWIDTTSAQDPHSGYLTCSGSSTRKAVATSIAWLGSSACGCVSPGAGMPTRLLFEQSRDEDCMHSPLDQAARFMATEIRPLLSLVASASTIVCGTRSYISQPMSAAHYTCIVSRRSDPAISAILLARSDMTA